MKTIHILSSENVLATQMCAKEPNGYSNWHDRYDYENEFSHECWIQFCLQFCTKVHKFWIDWLRFSSIDTKISKWKQIETNKNEERNKGHNDLITNCIFNMTNRNFSKLWYLRHLKHLMQMISATIDYKRETTIKLNFIVLLIQLIPYDLCGRNYSAICLFSLELQPPELAVWNNNWIFEMIESQMLAHWFK